MRTEVTIGLVVLISLVSRTARSDTIGLYSDPSGASCNVVAAFPGITSVYVVHETDGATASVFQARKPECWTGAVWIGDAPLYCPGVGCGDSQWGIALNYGACMVGPIHVLTINYFVAGSSASCCLYPLRGHPDYGPEHPMVADCNYETQSAQGLMATVNGNGTCPCGYPVPVEETTWGALKTLYTE